MFNLSDILKKQKEENGRDIQAGNEAIPKEAVKEEVEDIRVLYEQVLAKVKVVYKTDLNLSSDS